MADKIKYVLELTKKEAAVLCMIHGAACGESELIKTLRDIAYSLTILDPSLDDAQMALWRQLGMPMIWTGRISG